MMWDFMQFMAVMLLIMAIFVGGMLLTIRAYSMSQCAKYGDIAGLETKHIGLDQCMINDPELGWMTFGERAATRIGQRLEGDETWKQ